MLCPTVPVTRQELGSTRCRTNQTAGPVIPARPGLASHRPRPGGAERPLHGAEAQARPAGRHLLPTPPECAARSAVGGTTRQSTGSEPRPPRLGSSPTITSGSATQGRRWPWGRHLASPCLSASGLLRGASVLGSAERQGAQWPPTQRSPPRPRARAKVTSCVHCTNHTHSSRRPRMPAEATPCANPVRPPHRPRVLSTPTPRTHQGHPVCLPRSPHVRAEHPPRPPCVPTPRAGQGDPVRPPH